MKPTTKDLKISVIINEDYEPLIEFKDENDADCFILKSSYKVSSICIGQNDKHTIIINQNTLKILLPYLQKFSETGELI
jgi:hypothetical protein